MELDRTAQVRIHLTTKSPDIALPDTGPILVSTDLRRYHLSTLVNNLLSSPSPIPLEFLINGQYLRTSLSEFLASQGLSSETTIQVEYVKALIPPVYSASYQHDDWVSSVDVDAQAGILSGSYDGVVRVWNTSNEVIASTTASDAPIKAVKFASQNQIVSAGMDRCIRLFKYNPTSEKPSLTPSLELYGHSASISSLAVHTPSSRLLSASDDHTIGIFSLKKSDLPSAPENLLPVSSNKRRKLSTSSSPPPQRGALGTLKGHTSQVSDVCFDARDATVAYSTSWDHSLKTWDLTTSKCVDTRTTSSSLFSVLHLPTQNLIAAGNANRGISLIDPRASAQNVVSMTLQGHRNFVVSLAREPGSEYRFVSGSHDGCCRVWDVRSAGRDGGGERTGSAVYVIEREGKAKGRDGGKAFSVAWDSEIGIVSGGEDMMVQVNRAGES